MTKVAIDLGIFGVLNRPMSTVELETEVKSDAILLSRKWSLEPGGNACAHISR